MKNSGVRIRKAVPDDAQELTRISFMAKRIWDYPQEYYKKWHDELTITTDYICYNTVFVAVSGSETAGYYSLVYNPEDRKFGKVFMEAGHWMEHLFIKPECMYKGIGTELVKHLKAYCKEKEISRVKIFVEPNARGFYEKSGAVFRYMSDSSIEDRQIPVFEFKL
ncbi:MAG: GNAT family N-acetyltransferase [Chitinispirillaceae bacterium]